MIYLDATAFVVGGATCADGPIMISENLSITG